jgi:S-adenosylmethionine hydrolase
VVSAGSYLFVCPDNGVLTLFLQNHPSRETRVIRNPECMLDEISGTFHGRDIFAPAAAKLARGLPFESVGPGISEPRELPIPKASWESPGSIAGEVIHVDRFGNAITNIPRSLLRQSGHEEGSAEVKAAGCTFNGIKQFYGQVPVEEALPIWGSGGFLEIAVNQGRASRKLGMKIGDSVTVRC